MISREQVQSWLVESGCTIMRLAQESGFTRPRLHDWLAGRQDIYLETARRIESAMWRIDARATARLERAEKKSRKSA